MDIKSVSEKDRIVFDKLATHPLQSWEWGEFRKKTGIDVVRLGRFDNDKLVETAQITFHKLPFTSYTIGYLPKCGLISPEMLMRLVALGKEKDCIFIKFEPNIEKNNWELSHLSGRTHVLPSPHPLFTKYTFQLDISKSEKELLSVMHPKTRYNIKVAQKHSVTVTEDNSEDAFKKYLELTFETTRRQKFYAHSQRYHTLMWETLYPCGIAHLLTASFEDVGHKHILVTWVLFLFNKVIYYPYGASSDSFRNVMASNLMMWEAIRWGKKMGAKKFDMWGALGPNPSPNESWYGFHRFKQGYGATLVEFAGSFDIVIQPAAYKIFNLLHTGREIFLKIKSNFRS
ncbi:peptidoglycan bridge formation glycyltransferase FemA/FemB family protein [Patescibacteria group bacterium]|nr:peptidoglycan bridge formation glycyltransferase FemA/FemB family protein [Patescibacteria group bacterium]